MINKPKERKEASIDVALLEGAWQDPTDQDKVYVELNNGPYANLLFTEDKYTRAGPPGNNGSWWIDGDTITFYSVNGDIEKVKVSFNDGKLIFGDKSYTKVELDVFQI